MMRDIGPALTKNGTDGLRQIDLAINWLLRSSWKIAATVIAVLLFMSQQQPPLQYGNGASTEEQQEFLRRYSNGMPTEQSQADRAVRDEPSSVVASPAVEEKTAPPQPPPSEPLHLNFAVGGFPKTGTTFLLKLLEDHPDIVVAHEEFCDVHLPDGDVKTTEWLGEASAARRNSTRTLRYGIKCPTMVRSPNAIENLAKLSDGTRLVVGLRHPVKWFQSFYNYR